MAQLRIRNERIHDLLRRGDLRLLRRTLTRLDEVQLASELDNLDPDDLQQVLQLLPDDRRPLVVAQMRYEAVGTLISQLAPEQAAELLDELNDDDAVDILQRIDPARLREILARLDKDDAEDLEELLAYEDDTAGGIMSTHFVVVAPDGTAAETIAELGQTDDLPRHLFYVFVVEAGGKLVGTCELRTLVISRPDARLRDIMQTEVVSVRVDTDQEQVADLVGRYDLVTVPVVNEAGHLIGVIEVDDVVDVIREEATEDILKMAGAGEDLAEARAFWQSLRVRWRWLMAAAAGGSVAAMSLSGFDDALAAVPALAFFMPVVAGMGGNVGMQSSTIVVRGLAVGFIEAQRIRKLVVREVGLGLSLGLIYGLLIGAVALWVGADLVAPWRLGVVVAAGCAGSMTVAAFVGTATPLMLDRFGVDPAIATGPFVTTSVDVMGLLFYFWLAQVLLGVGP